MVICELANQCSERFVVALATTGAKLGALIRSVDSLKRAQDGKQKKMTWKLTKLGTDTVAWQEETTQCLNKHLHVSGGRS